MNRILLLLLLLPVFAKAQLITTFAGNGTIGYTGTGGPATAAEFSEIIGVAVDSAGNVYIPDVTNNVVRMVSTTGIITNVAGTGTQGYSGDGGAATAATLFGPYNVAFDKAGNMYIVEHGNNLVRKVDIAGTITTFAGTGVLSYTGDYGPATAATFDYPWGIAIDDTGNVYLADGGNNVIREIDTFGTITTIAGNNIAGYNSDGIPATAAELHNPTGLAWNKKNGSLYIADNQNNRIRVVDTTGMISTLTGNGSATDLGDGGAPATATINNPMGISIDTAGNLYFADFGNNVIRAIKGNVIDRYAGNAVNGFSGDGGSAVLAELSEPWGTAVDKNGSVYIGDLNNNRVRKVYTPVITTSVAHIYSQQNGITIFPNPAFTELNITSVGKITNITISDLLGQTIYTNQYNAQQIQVDVSTLAAGIYFLKVNGSEVRKFVKE